MKATLVLGALALGSAIALATTVANAAPPPPPNISLGLTFGNTDESPPSDNEDCQSTKSIISDLRDQGYRHFTHFDDSGDDTFTVDAQRGTRWYELEVDNCSGDIVDRTRIRFNG